MSKSANWAQSEIDFLIANKDKSFKELSQSLRRTERAVAMKVAHLKRDGIFLQKRQREVHLTPVQEDFLIKHYASCSILELASIMGLGKNTIIKQAKILNLPKKTIPIRTPKLNFACRNPDCDNVVQHTPRDIEAGRKQFCDKNCMTGNRKILSKLDIKNLIHLYEEEAWSGIDLANKFNVDDSTIYRTLKEAGIKVRSINSSGKNCVYQDVTFRSTWEMKFARWLTENDITWKYEPKRFYYEKIKSGTQSYLPDFFLPEYINPYTNVVGTWIEVKGYLRPRGKTGIRRMKIHYPQEFAQLMYVSGKNNKVTNEFFTNLGVPLFKYIEEL